MIDTVKNRVEIEEKYTWNLKDLYADEGQWEAEKKSVKAQSNLIESYSGRVIESAETLADLLCFMDEMQRKLTKLSCYAGMMSDQDTKVSKYQGMKQEIGQIYNDFATKAAFIEPEILSGDPQVIASYIEEDPRLKDFDFYLKDILRMKPHRHSEAVEKVIAQAGLMSNNASSIYNVFFNADFPFPETILQDGSKVTLNFPTFAKHRASSNPLDRKTVFSTFFGKIGDFERTFGVQLYSHLKRDLFYTKTRNYPDGLSAALHKDNIPTAVYEQLISNVNENLSTFHRYLALRQKMMNLDTLHYYDLYAPLVQDVDLSFDIEKAKSKILASLAPLGQDYQQVVNQAFEERWIDYLPNIGKRSGAYSNGATYDVHPYILMNFNGKYDDVSTLTHELGHTMQSYLSNKTQPHSKAHYSIFVAEVASTLNEELLNDYLLSEITDEKVRLSILGNYLEGAKGTLFRQTQFAEFEWLIHQKVEAGESLTGEQFSALYFDLTKKYYGHEEGVCTVEDYIQYEWAYIPHFYYNFYVYQYATSFTASQAIVEKLLQGGEKERQQYIDFLSAGGSQHPIDLLKMAGVDMETSQPFELTLKKINRVMDEMEALLE